jgi:hypothetical protein
MQANGRPAAAAATAAAAAAGHAVMAPAAAADVPQRPGSALGRHRGGDLLQQALHHHQRELGALLGPPPAAAAAAGPAGALSQQQGMGVLPDQLLQQQPRAATPLWQVGMPRVSFSGMQQRRSDAGDSASWDAHRYVFLGLVRVWDLGFSNPKP